MSSLMENTVANSGPPLWLYLHFPKLQLNSLYADDDSTPIIIVDEKTHAAVQVNHSALQQGIDVGMGLGSAASLCQDLKVYPYDQAIEQQRLQHIARWLYLLSADICLYPPNGLLLKVSNMLTLYHGLDNYWLALSSHLAQLDVDYHYGTGFSVYSSMLLAKNHGDIISADKPYLERALRPLTLAQTGLSKKNIENLKRVGIEQLHQLLALPLTEIAKRFDIDLVNYVGRFTAQLQHPVSFFHPSEQFSHFLELLFEIRNLQYLQKPLLKVYELLERFLSLRDKRCQQVLLTLHFRDDEVEPKVVSISSAYGEYRAQSWLELSQLTLESLRIEAPIVALTVDAKQVHANDYQKADLFSGKQGAVSANELVSRLQAKLGENAIVGVQSINEHRPERAVRCCQPLLNRSQDGNTKRGKQQITKNSGLSHRPSVLLPQPLPLDEQVTLQHGPERIISGWWDEQYMARDYFIACSEQGRWLWLFRTPEQEWFVHGLFS
ncbi:Y-family DNA polymerase [Thalassotalea sp. HSM 43]|uniref:Y-family DNA polymerase n=1 Tax=Thalassotalea sp. HSM 43 TaxID=2552945 RepID=UPI001E4695CD|nr:DNA polymerase Y family protein [Thalassotalea sp. HSM 43]